jgi:hypothetical protein
VGLALACADEGARSKAAQSEWEIARGPAQPVGRRSPAYSRKSMILLDKMHATQWVGLHSRFHIYHTFNFQ